MGPSELTSTRDWYLVSDLFHKNEFYLFDLIVTLEIVPLEPSY